VQTKQNDRTLNGAEQQQERIVIKRIANSIKKIEFEMQFNNNEIEKLGIDTEEKKLQIANLTERMKQGKRLINGEKMCDVFPDPNLVKENTE